MKSFKLKTRFIYGFVFCMFLGSMDDVAQSQESVVASGKQVSIEYTLTLEDKSVVDSNVGAEPLTFVQGAHNIVSGLENALDGMKVGDSKRVVVKPEDAYGPLDENAFSEISKEQVPQDGLKVGAILQGQSAEGNMIVARVVEIKEKTVLLDFNHPLAGKTLYFDIKIVEVQEVPAS